MNKAKCDHEWHLISYGGAPKGVFHCSKCGKMKANQTSKRLHHNWTSAMVRQLAGMNS